MKSALLLPLVLFLTAQQASADTTIYGLTEYVRIEEYDLRVPAKLDTGARTASLSAHNIQRFSRDGEDWVRFTPNLKGYDGAPLERPLARVSRIKRRSDEFEPGDEPGYSARPVIELDICLGRARSTIEVNLTDRSAFIYPLLIGSKALRNLSAIVDPAQKFAAGEPGCPDASTPGE